MSIVNTQQGIYLAPSSNYANSERLNEYLIIANGGMNIYRYSAKNSEAATERAKKLDLDEFVVFDAKNIEIIK